MTLKGLTFRARSSTSRSTQRQVNSFSNHTMNAPNPGAPCSSFLIPSLLKRHAHTVGVNRSEFLGPPRLGLQRTIGMHLAAPLLVFGIQRLNTLHGQTHHSLVADLPCQDFVAHASDVEVRLAAVDTCISWRGSVAKSFLEAADLRPPLQRFRSVGSGENGDRAFNDRVFNGHDWLHRQSVNQPISNCKYKNKALPSVSLLPARRRRFRAPSTDQLRISLDKMIYTSK